MKLFWSFGYPGYVVLPLPSFQLQSWYSHVAEGREEACRVVDVSVDADEGAHRGAELPLRSAVAAAVAGAAVDGRLARVARPDGRVLRVARLGGRAAVRSALFPLGSRATRDEEEEPGQGRDVRSHAFELSRATCLDP